MLNAAVWLGTAAVTAFVIWPGFFTPDMLQVLPPLHAGAAAHVLLRRCILLQYGCAAVAVTLLGLEWLYSGKTLSRWSTYLLLGILGAALFTGAIVQPKAKRWHLAKHLPASSAEERAQGVRSLPLWEGLLQLSNIVTVLALGVYVWEISSAATNPKFVSASKFRG
jgi:hypothetical protein